MNARPRPRPIQTGPLWASSPSSDDRNFWGVTVKPGKSKKVKFNGDLLCVTQATLGRRSKNMPKRNGRTCLYVKEGRKRPFCVCSLRIRILEMWVLHLLYKSPCNNIRFINHGCYSIHLVGYSYFLPTPRTSSPIDTTHVAEEETSQEPVVENGRHGQNTILLNECDTLGDDKENRVGETASILPEDDDRNITTTIPEDKECDSKDGLATNAHGRLVCALEIPKRKKRKMNNVESQSVSIVEIPKKKRKKDKKIAAESVGLLESEQIAQPPKTKRKGKDISGNDVEKLSDTTNAIEEPLKEPVAENGGHNHQNTLPNESETLGAEDHRVGEAVSILPDDINTNIFNIVREIEDSAPKDVYDDEEHPHIPLESDKNAGESFTLVSCEISKKKRKKSKKVESESASLPEVEEIALPPKSRTKVKGVSGNEAEKSLSGVGEGENPTSLNSRQAGTEEILKPTPLSIYVPTPKGVKEKPSDRSITNEEHQVSFSGTPSWPQDFVLGLNARAKDHAEAKSRKDPNPNIIDEHDIRFEMFHN